MSSKFALGLALAGVLALVWVATTRRGPSPQALNLPKARPAWSTPPRVAPSHFRASSLTTRRAAVVRRAAGSALAARPAPPQESLPAGEPTELPEILFDGEPLVPLEVAHIALAFVGDDPEAEEVWIEAINDPALATQDRKALIENLNSEGFPDLDDMSEEDVPLIVSRLALIEELGPESMDEVNAAAFDNAYRDLVGMLAQLVDLSEWEDDGEGPDMDEDEDTSTPALETLTYQDHERTIRRPLRGR